MKPFMMDRLRLHRCFLLYFPAFLASFSVISGSFAAQAPSSESTATQSQVSPINSGALEAETDVIEREFPMRRVVSLHLSNLRGGITVQGWSQDRIRVHATRKVAAESAEARTHFREAADIRFAAVEGVYEVSAEYGRSLSLEERLRERAQPRTQMDLVVQVPQGLSMRVGTVDGAIKLSAWKGNAEIRSSSGAIDLDSVEGDSLSAFCDDCSLHIKNVKGNLRANTRSGEVRLEAIQSTSLFVETQTGRISAKNVHSPQQLYVSHAGDFSAESIEGNVEFSNTSGNVNVKGLRGFISGRTLTGSVNVDVDVWKFSERALFESQEGRVSLRLPRDFVGEVELRSAAGSESLLRFPLYPPLYHVCRPGYKGHEDLTSSPPSSVFTTAVSLECPTECWQLKTRVALVAGLNPTCHHTS